MADVADRGQVILITGLAVAVTLVGVVLVLNSAIYTENLATRSTGTGATDAVEFRRAAVDGVGGLVDRENAAEYDTYGAVASEVRAGTDRLGDLLTRSRVRSGVVAELAIAEVWEGRLVRQTDASRALTADDGDPSWTLAGNVEAVRNFSVTVDESDLSGTDPASGFTAVADGGGDRWRAAVYDDGGLTLAVRNATDGSWTTDICADAVAATTTVDLTRGTVNGEPCSALAFGRGVKAPYDLGYRNGDAAAGTYNLTLNTTGDATVASGNFDEPGSPSVVAAVYGLELALHYERAELTFADEVRVAPGESR